MCVTTLARTQHCAWQSGARIQTKILKNYLGDVWKINKALLNNGEWEKLKRKLSPIPQNLIYF
jgi:hypothetical protein